MRTSEIMAFSTKCGIKMNINMAHCLLGHCNEDSLRKTARELGWVFAADALKPCKHCAKSKAEQKSTKRDNRYKGREAGT